MTVASSPPDLAALRTLLEPHVRESFSEAALHRGCPPLITIGQYLSSLVERGATQDSELTGGCEAGDDAYWTCRIVARSFAADVVQLTELRVRVRKADRWVDRATLSCTGP